MIMTGQHVATKKAKKSGLLDLVVPKGQNVIDAACEFVLSKGGKTRLDARSLCARFVGSSSHRSCCKLVASCTSHACQAGAQAHVRTRA